MTYLLVFVPPPLPHPLKHHSLATWVIGGSVTQIIHNWQVLTLWKGQFSHREEAPRLSFSSTKLLLLRYFSVFVTGNSHSDPAGKGLSEFWTQLWGRNSWVVAREPKCRGNWAQFSYSAQSSLTLTMFSKISVGLQRMLSFLQKKSTKWGMGR